MRVVSGTLKYVFLFSILYLCVGCSASIRDTQTIGDRPVNTRTAGISQPTAQEELIKDDDVRMLCDVFETIDKYYIHSDKLNYIIPLNTELCEWENRLSIWHNTYHKFDRIPRNASAKEAQAIFYQNLYGLKKILKKILRPPFREFSQRPLWMEVAVHFIYSLHGSHNDFHTPEEWPEIKKEIDNSPHFPQHAILTRGNTNFLYIPLRKFVFADIPQSIADDLKSKNCRGIILDLRGNPGGYTGDLKRLLFYFLSGPKPVMTVKTKDGKKNYDINIPANHRASITAPLVVLIDWSSCSGSEIFAYTIQYYKRGVVIGSKTSGVANMGYVSELSQNSGMMIEAGIVYMADGLPIEGRGVTPDIQIEDNGIKQAIDILTK